VNGLQTTGDIYTMKFIITNENYTINTLIEHINGLFYNEPVTKGTVMYIESSKVKIRFNINKLFSTKDFRVVFYDPYSFVKCYSGATHKGSQSVQNATWDSTLGWILGFRNAIEYNLAQYENEPDTYNYYLPAQSNICLMTGDTCVSTNLYNYFLIMLDDYVQNHLNDGLVTITSQETSLAHKPFKRICDDNGIDIIVPVDYGDPGVTYTQAELYTFNQQVISEKTKAHSYSSGPFVHDIFGIIPVKTSGLAVGSSYVEFGGTLQNQQRIYFGPVNIHRMSIRLLNDRGNLVDLNNSNWSFSLICEQLYRNGL
jgi:hypothetical protein